MTSINTNKNAIQALQVLNGATRSLEETQKRISTGLNVSGAKDSGAVYGIAQSMRADQASKMAANDSLLRAQSILEVASSAASSITERLMGLKELALGLNDPSISAATRTTLLNDLKAILGQITNIADNANFDGVNLLKPKLDSDFPVVYNVNSPFEISPNISVTLDGRPGMVIYDFRVKNHLNYSREYSAPDHDFFSSTPKADWDAYFTSLGGTQANSTDTFNKIDLDGDGVMTHVEKDSYFRQPGRAIIDANSDGQATQAEFRAVVNSWGNGATTAQADAAFAKIDTDADGNISQTELTEYQKNVYLTPNRNMVVTANLNMKAENGYFDENRSYTVSAPNTPGARFATGQAAFRYAFNPYLEDLGPSDVSFTGNATVSPISNPTGTPVSEPYGTSLTKITHIPFKDYKIDVLKSSDGSSLKILKQPMTLELMGLQNLADMQPQEMLQTITSAINDASYFEGYFGVQQKTVEGLIDQNTKLVDAVEGGVSNLVDADLAKESAILQAQQVKQQLGLQSLGIANEQPSWVLRLFE